MDSEPTSVPSVPEEVPVLTNRYHFDENSLRDSYRLLLKPYVILQTVLGCIMLGLAVYYTLRCASYFSANKSLLLMIALLYGFAGFELWKARSSVDKAVKRALQRTEELRGVREYDVILRFGEEEIAVGNSATDETGTLDYVEFKSIKRGEKLITIRTTTRTLCTLDPARFENGTEADFWALMNRKCQFAVPKDRRTP